VTLDLDFKVVRNQTYRRPRRIVCAADARSVCDSQVLVAFWHQDPRWRISAILDFRGPIIGSLESPCTTSDRSSIDTIVLNCLVFEKIAFAFWRQTNRQTDIRQTNGQTDGYHRCVKPQSRCRELRLNNAV